VLVPTCVTHLLTHIITTLSPPFHFHFDFDFDFHSFFLQLTFLAPFWCDQRVVWERTTRLCHRGVQLFIATIAMVSPENLFGFVFCF
jgi:hypothetical protein